MTGEGFAGASAGAAGRGPFPGASYSGKFPTFFLLAHMSMSLFRGESMLLGGPPL